MPLDANASLSAPLGERPTSYKVYRDDVEIAPENLPLRRAARGEELRDEEVEVRFANGGR